MSVASGSHINATLRAQPAAALHAFKRTATAAASFAHTGHSLHASRRFRVPRNVCHRGRRGVSGRRRQNDSLGVFQWRSGQRRNARAPCSRKRASIDPAASLAPVHAEVVNACPCNPQGRRAARGQHTTAPACSTKRGQPRRGGQGGQPLPGEPQRHCAARHKGRLHLPLKQPRNSSPTTLSRPPQNTLHSHKHQ